jgi:hypothetical protein
MTDAGPAEYMQPRVQSCGSASAARQKQIEDRKERQRHKRDEDEALGLHNILQQLSGRGAQADVNRRTWAWSGVSFEIRSRQMQS